MHNHTPERVAFLEGIGVKRAILARELSLEEIRAIRRQAPTIELETFVHGALCVSYSGQCYLSYALGGRSGNRGQCAQPCRKAYTLTDARGRLLEDARHLLSLRDLNLADHLGELLQAGVCSFKIEGRLKDLAYVKNVVSHYRAKLDEAITAQGLRRSSSGTSTIDFTPDVRKTFNRGFTTHFLHGRGEPMGAIATPKMVGEEIGPIVAVHKRSVTVSSATPLHKGDGICFFTRTGELSGTVVNDANGLTFFPYNMEGLERGTLIYRNHDHEFLTRVEQRPAERKIALTFTVRETPDGIALLAVDEDGNRATCAHACEKTPAEKPEAALANLRKQLQKCGGTPFACTDVTVELSAPYFFPVSLLNALRRETLEALLAAREAQRPTEQGGVIQNTLPYPETELSYQGNVLNRKAATFYRRHGVVSIWPGAESGVNLRGRKVMTTRYCLKHQLGLCPRQSTERLAEPLTLTDGEGHQLELSFNCNTCTMEVYLKKG